MNVKAVLENLVGVAIRWGNPLLSKKPRSNASHSTNQPQAAPVNIFSDDVFLVSYPKSGNTWLRFQIGSYLLDAPIDFVGLHHVMPDQHLDPTLAAPAQFRPRFIKSHASYDPAYPRVIYIIRDPRDVAVSAYFHHIKFKLLPKETSFDEFMQRFIEIGFYPQGLWSDHVEGWLSASRASVQLITYEEMLDSPAAILSTCLRFGGVEIDEKRIERAVENSSKERMQEVEDVQHEEYFRRHGSDTTQIRFVREGRAGSWQSYFSSNVLQAFMERYGQTMRKVGYI